MTKESSQTQGKNKEQSRALSPKTAKLWFDGGTFPLNPGHGGSGAVLAFEGKEHSFSEYIGEKETNNRAEYGGLLLGLKKALEMGITDLEVYGDSQLVIYQMTGTYACRNSGSNREKFLRKSVFWVIYGKFPYIIQSDQSSIAQNSFQRASRQVQEDAAFHIICVPPR
jgi:ribonuclease HI